MDIVNSVLGGLKSLAGLDTPPSQDQAKDASSRNSHKSLQKLESAHDPATKIGDEPDDHVRAASAQQNRRHETNGVPRNTMTVSDRTKRRPSDFVSQTVKLTTDKKRRKFGGPTFKPQNSLGKKPFAQVGTSTQSYGRRGSKNNFGTLHLESTRGDNVARSANGNSQKESKEPASKRRRMTWEPQPTRRATDESDGSTILVGGRTLQSSPIKRGSNGFAEGHGRPFFRNVHSTSAARTARPPVVDLDDDNDDIVVSSPPAASRIDSRRQTSTTGQLIENMDVAISEVPDSLVEKHTKRHTQKAKKQATSTDANHTEGSASERQSAVVVDDPTKPSPIDFRSQQQEISKIREANRPARTSGSPEVRVSRFFEKVPMISPGKADSASVQEAPQSPTESTATAKDRKLTQEHPSRSYLAKQHAHGIQRHDGKPRFRDRMTQQAVNTSPVAAKKTTAQSESEEGKIGLEAPNDDGSNSEDELSGPVTRSEVPAPLPSNRTQPSSPLLFSDQEVSFTEPPAGEIKSKTFRSGSSSVLVTQPHALSSSRSFFRYFPVNRVFTRVVRRNCDGSNDELAFNDEHKAFEIWIDGTPLNRPSTSEVLRYTSNHFHAVWHCDDSLRVIIRGSHDDISTGVLLFEFGDFKSKESFLGTLRDAFRQTRYSPNIDSSYLESHDNRWANCLKELQEAPLNEEAIAKKLPADEASRVPPLPQRSQRIGISSDNIGEDTQPQTSAQQPTNSGQRQTYVIVEKQAAPARASTRVKSKPAKARDQITEQEVPIERFRFKHNIRPWEEPLTYPPVGQKRTTVNFEDLDRIDEGDLLNDNIVNFCLRKAEYEHEELADKVFFFNTYFFSTLTTTRAKKRGFNYEAVKRWTKKVDLFSLPYVIVPINISFHWYLVIICNLQNLPRGDAPLEEAQEIIASDEEMRDGPGQEPPSSAPQGDMPSKEFKRMSLDDVEIQNVPHGKHDADFEIPDSDDERKKQAAYESALANSQEDLPKADEVTMKVPKKKSAAPIRRWSPDQPLIITLDSFGASHSQEVKMLKEYIVAEALDKRGLTIEPKQIQGITAKGIPEQTNMSDCGVFLIGYVEEFLKDPRRFVEKVCSKEMDRNNDFQGFEPREKRIEIRDTLVKLSTEQIQKKEEEKQKKRDAKRKATEQAGGDAKRIASSPVKDPSPIKDPGEGPEVPADNVSDLDVSSPAKRSAIEMAIRGPTSMLEGIGEFL